MLQEYCTMHGQPLDAGVAFFTRLQKEAFKHPDEVLGEVEATAQRLWTSAIKLDGVPVKFKKEFCSILNEILRNDCDGKIMKYACRLTRAINGLLLMRRSGESVHFPEDGYTFRGGALPMEHFPFYSVGKKYRVPMFLATPFNRDKALEFMLRAFMDGQTPVLWTVRIDP